MVFRVMVQGPKYIRVSVFDRRSEMLADMGKRHGLPHQGEIAVTLSEFGDNCIADLFFYWRGLRPSIVAHEASHAAWAIALALGKGIGPDSDEFIADHVEKITEKILMRTAIAPL